MAKIFYSMAGEGRGHAMRVRTLVEQLRGQHRLKLFAPADAYQMLAPLYAGSEVEVERIPGLLFQYNDRKELDFLATAREGLRYMWRSRALRATLRRMILEEEPDLVITDFEPSLPRAAQDCGVPFLSITHQHFLVVSDLEGLPWELQAHAAFMAEIVKTYYSRPRDMVVSSFYFPPLKSDYRHVTQVGVLLRPSLLATRPEEGDHLLVYLRRNASVTMLEAFKSCGREVRIYGLGAQPDDGPLRYRPIDDAGFLRDLAGCQALISTAGNQLVGEALYLGKPALVMPEPKNYEQAINAHFLKQGGAGDWVEFHALNGRCIGAFLENLVEYRAQIDRARLNGNPATLEVIRRHLPGGSNGHGSAKMRTPSRALAET